MKWLIRWLVKPIIKPVKEAVRLCDKLIASTDKLVEVVNGLPLDQAFKDELLGTISVAVNAITAVRSVLVKVLEYTGTDVPSTDDDDSIETTIESVHKSLK